MALLLELENAANWIVRDSQFLQVAPENPIPNYLSIEIFNSNVIGVLVNNTEARDTWNFAGWLERQINLPFGPDLVTSSADYRKLWLRQKQLIIFPTTVSNYRITVRFPKWFTQANITIWEYQGAGANDTGKYSSIPTEQAIDSIDLRLNNINFQPILDKLNDLQL